RCYAATITRPVSGELPRGLEALDAGEGLQPVLLPAGNRRAERLGLSGKAGLEVLPHVTQGRALEGGGLFAHLGEGIELDVEVTNLAERILERAHHLVGAAHPLVVAEEHQRSAEPAGGHAGIVDWGGGERPTQLPELTRDVREPATEERPGRFRHGRGGLQTSDGGGLGHRRGCSLAPPGPGAGHPRSRASISASSRLSSAAATFSSRGATDEVPGMGSITGDFKSNQARPTR